MYSESTEEGVPLSEVMEFGLERPRFAADCFAVLLKELKLNFKDGWNKYPLMIIIDGNFISFFNLFFKEIVNFSGINVIFQERTYVTKSVPRRRNHQVINNKFLRKATCAPEELSLLVAMKHMLK